MSDWTFSQPLILLLAVPLLVGLILASRRLTGLAPWRRRGALALHAGAMLLLLGALAGPARVQPDRDLGLVLVLDATPSVEQAARSGAVAYAQAVLAGAGPGTDLHFIALSDHATLLTPAEITSGAWAAPNPQALTSNPQSDLAAGLRLAGGLLGETGRRRVVLLSDGWETTGDAAAEAARLAARGIDVQTVALAALGTPEVIVTGLDAPATVRRGDPLAGSLTVSSTGPTTATLRLRVDGVAQPPQQLTLRAGDNRIPLAQRAVAEGWYALEATLEAAADTVTTNNQAATTVVVKPPARIMVIEEHYGEATHLVSALAVAGMIVDVRAPAAVGTSSTALAVYDAVVLHDVAATSFPLDAQRTLQEYVRRGGHGLVVVGGAAGYARGGYPDTVLEELLPVLAQPPPRPPEGNTALILILDRSRSMDEGKRINNGVTNFTMAKTAAQLAVDALRPGDSLGVLTFDTLNNWAVPLQTITGDADKTRIKALIDGIRLGGGTSIYPAVQEAALAIEALDAPARHLVLLTDGREVRSGDYDTLLEGLRAGGISLSAIGIGKDADKALLTRLARDGGGRYYFTERTDSIPQVVFKELDLALKQAVVEGRVQPHFAAPSPIMQGFAPQDVPALGGYDLTTGKEEAVVALVSDAGDPLLVHWNYGLGRVVAFTADAGPQWAAPWLAWDGFAPFWAGAVRWTLAAPVSRQLQPSITVEPGAGAGVAHLVVESLRPDNTFADLAPPTASVRAPSGAITTTLLVQSAPGRYEARVPLAEAGAYEVRLTGQDGATALSETAGFHTPLPAEWLHAGSNGRLLLALSGGAAPLTTPAEALDPRALPPAPAGQQAFWPFLLFLALLLLLGSVAVRRLDVRRRG